MSSEPLPDHYKALGIDKNADAATIKKTYRKLVLTCHPDKVTDEALKAQKQDEFHKIQQAYETLSDETRRATYEAELKLQQLRREKLARTASGSTVEQKSARFAQPTSGGSYTAHTASRYATEERRPSNATPSRRTEYEDDYYRSSRKDSYFSSPRRQSPRPSPSSRSSKEKVEKEVRREKASTDRTRSSTQKTRDSERRDRTGRFPVESEGSSEEEKVRYAYRTRPAEDDSRKREEYRRDDRRDDRDRRYDDMFDTSPRKTSAQPSKEEEAKRYISKSRAAAEPRPSPVRTTSRDYYEPSSRSSRHREVRPEPAPRRSSARPKESSRGIPDIVEWERPSFTHSASSPAEIRLPPQRSVTESYRRSGGSPPRAPVLSRSATMPVNAGLDAGGSRRESRRDPRAPSGLRNEANSSPERDAYPSIPAAQPSSSSKTYYSYSPADGGVKPMEAPRTILREPARTRHRSPSPLGKPPIGANRPPLHSSKTYTPTGRSSRQTSPVREERGRSERMKYGEMPSDYTRRRGIGERQPSYDASHVSYAPRFGPEDVRWAPRGREAEYAERKPGLSRAQTASVTAH
jgi:curved DNA-binding protein CbpA